MKTYLSYFLMLGLFVSAPVWAQDAEELEGDDTITVLDEGEDPSNLENDLALPEDAAPEGVENSAFGLETANQARELGREFGQQRAAEARESNRDEAVRENIGQERAEQAQQQGGAP